MHLKSILNRVEQHKCFVYTRIRFVDGLVEPELEVEIEPRANSRAICSGCGEKRPGYDRLAPRLRPHDLRATAQVREPSA